MRSLVPPLLAAALAVAGPLAGQSRPSRDWSPDDRTVVGDFTRITSVAATIDRVYFTSPTTLLIWQPQFRRWEGPFDPPERGYLDRVFAALVDPVDQSLWLARPDAWVHYNHDLRQWEAGAIPGGVREIAFDLEQPLSGPLFRTATGWVALPRGGFTPAPSRPPARPLRPGTIEEAMRENPSLRANAAAILTTSRLRSARYSAAARAVGSPGWYIGTIGAGALFLPDGAPLPERLEWGLPSELVSAVFAAPDGVWALSEPTAAAEGGLTFARADLSEFRSYLGSPAFGLPFTRARDLVGRGRDLWAATDRGLARIPTDGGAIDVLDATRGLPDDRVLSVAVRRGALVVGTAHGIARVSDSLDVERLARNFTDAVYAVAIDGDTVWVGTPLGVFFALPGEADLVQPVELASAPSLRVPVLGLTWLGDTLVAMTQDRLAWRHPVTRQWTQGPPLSTLLGRLRVLVAWRDGVWVGGERGVGYARLNSPPIRPLLAPGDTPGEVLDLAVDEDYLWVGTVAGLVRWRLEAIRP